MAILQLGRPDLGKITLQSYRTSYRDFVEPGFWTTSNLTNQLAKSREHPTAPSAAGSAQIFLTPAQPPPRPRPRSLHPPPHACSTNLPPAIWRFCHLWNGLRVPGGDQCPHETWMKPSGLDDNILKSHSPNPQKTHDIRCNSYTHQLLFSVKPQEKKTVSATPGSFGSWWITDPKNAPKNARLKGESYINYHQICILFTGWISQPPKSPHSKSKWGCFNASILIRT